LLLNFDQEEATIHDLSAMQKINEGDETELPQKTQMDMHPLWQGGDATAKASTQEAGTL
jgi:hypothetical protein